MGVVTSGLCSGWDVSIDIKWTAGLSQACCWDPRVLAESGSKSKE